MADLSGPKMRIGQRKEEPVELKQGDMPMRTADDVPGDRGIGAFAGGSGDREILPVSSQVWY